MRFVFILLGALVSLQTKAQEQVRIDFENYNPPSTLRVEENVKTRAKFPFVDIHNHQRSLDANAQKTLLTAMDTLNMRVMVNLSGGTGDRLKQQIDALKQTGTDRFVVFANIDFNGIGSNGWTEKAVKQLEVDIKYGAKGVKIFKSLGFSVKDVDGKLVAIDDKRLAPLWELCGKLKVPVLIHTADPPSFWDEMNNNNERLLELYTHPGRKRGPNDPAPFDTLIAQQHRLFKNHPNTTFIAAHFGWYPNDLKYLGSLLDAMPNMMIEMGAVIAELGRQPRAAKAFFEKYSDRILMGKDSWVPSEYTTYFRVLETNDEYFPYHKKYHAFWAMYGMGLSDEVLKKVYYKNAAKLLGLKLNIFE